MINFPLKFNTYILSKALKICLKALLLFFSVLILACLKFLFLKENSFGFYPSEFVQAVAATVKNLYGLKNGSIMLPYTFDPVPILTYLPNAYRYSLTLLFGALFLGVGLAFIFLYLYLWLPLGVRRRVRKLVSILETLPDLFIIMSFQFAVIYLYKQTGLKILQLYSLDTEVYIMPIICLMLVPFFMLLRIMITVFEEEYEKLYVEFAKAKGLSRLEVFTKHVLRNIVYSFTQYLGVIYWMMITSLILVEYLSLINGFTFMLYRFVSGEIFILGVGLILLPYGFILLAVKLLLRNRSAA
ncbi:ABC transporter permease subunit [Bacillus sp. EB01]|uniref:ABC transporter permease subunit n=1 Tax=Bacillus sp. EB01 TaxID=1347086 RepID=UPI0005C64537|nr:ABC transporter permease subunit [Bacillus sp. EB01]